MHQEKRFKVKTRLGNAETQLYYLQAAGYGATAGYWGIRYDALEEHRRHDNKRR
jgi:hypothetical protein